MQIQLHLTTYDRLGENPVVGSGRSLTLESLPAVGQHLVVDGAPFSVAATYLAIPGDQAHVFATATSLPADHAKAMGLRQDSAGYASLAAFEGSTLGELSAFLADYPQDMEVVFPDRQVLVAKAKGDMLILRLDDREDHV